MQNYSDILDLPHHASAKHARMRKVDRAAQFSPFAALTGYDAEVRETARLTDVRMELDESKKYMLNEKLRLILRILEKKPEIAITYFVPDEKKTGGAYKRVTGVVKKIDEFKRTVVMTDETIIAIEQIIEIDGDCFDALKLI